VPYPIRAWGHFQVREVRHLPLCRQRPLLPDGVGWRAARRGVVAVLAMMPVVAQAQTASQIVPQTFRPNLQRQGGFSLPGTPGLGTPVGAEKLFVRLSGVAIKGGLPQLAAATVELERRLVDRAVSGAEIFAAARDLEAAYARAGFVLVRVVLPPQRLVDGARLRLTVVDGFIERVELKDVPERVRARLSGLLEPLVGKRALTLTELERRVLLAGDTPGTLLRSTLAPGTAEGATVLVIEAKYQAVSGVASFDNTLSRSFGYTTAGAGVDFNSIAGLGELVYLRANGHPEGGNNGFADRYPTNRTLAGGFVLPLMLDGLGFNAEVTDARTTPRENLGVQTTSRFQRLSLRLRYNWLRGRIANSNSEVTFDAQDETQSLFVANDPIPLSQDRLRILRFTHDGDVLMPWGGTIFAKVTGSVGIDGLGARSAADATALLPLSRQGADASFHKVEVTLGYARSLLEHLSIHLTTRGQTSFGRALLRSEQIGIANTAGLSTFDAGTIVGDWGHVSRGELSSPWNLPLPNSAVDVVAAPYLFAAYGRVALAQPTFVEAAHIGAVSYGGGVRFGGTVPGTLVNGTLTLEYGRATRSDAVPTADRFTIISAARF
jgi:hemolysin activation/secretion protein